MRRMQRFTRLAAALPLLLLLGCPKSRFHAGTSADPIRYVFVARSSEDAMSAVAIKAAETTVSQVAGGAGLYYRIERAVPASATPAAQAAAIDSAAASSPDGIVVATSSAPVVDAALRRATAKRIPVVLLWLDAPGTGRLVVCGPNDIVIGEEMARQFVDARADSSPGKIAVLSSDAKSASYQDRIRGLDRYLRRAAPDLRLLKPLYCDSDPAKAAALVKEVRAKNADLRGVLLLGDWLLSASGGRAALPDPAKVTVVAADLSNGARSALRQGRIARLVAPRCVEAGREAVQALERFRQQTKDEFAPIDTGFDLIFKDAATRPIVADRRGPRPFSAGEYDDLWQRWLDSGTDDL